MSSALRAVRAAGAVICAAVESWTAWLLMAPAVAVAAAGVGLLLATPTNWAGGLLLTLGGVVAASGAGVLLARPLMLVGQRRLAPCSPPPAGWFDTRAVAWFVVTLFVRAPLSAVVAVLSLGLVVAIWTPVLVAGGGSVDLGPWRVQSATGAFGVTLAACLPILAAPKAIHAIDRGDRLLAAAVLKSSQERLERQLRDTTSSRARIVNANDHERRRLERDLHDGIQPEILAVSVTLGLALTQMPPYAPARELVEKAQQQSLEALESLRRVVRGVHPQVLDDHGLAAAITELARSLPTPVTLTAPLTQRLPSDAESSLYFATSELLANVAKHSSAAHSRVDIAIVDGVAQVTVEDDGQGGADPQGRGLTGVKDRLASFDGTFEIDSPPGGPTRARLTLPVRGPQ